MAIAFLRDDPLVPGVVQTLRPGLRRVLCDNPSAYTFRGTNSWIIGEGAVAILDPGPDDRAHRAALLAAVAGERVTHILVSHTHRDHSPGAAPLAAATGAPTHGFGPHATPADAGGEGGDHGFRPDVALADGAVVTGAGWALTALHTPGHCANHLCFAWDAQGVLFSGDHVMGWSTTVVAPPDGDMAAYLAGLARLRDRAGVTRMYLPGHGPPIPEPHGFVTALIAHRLAREAAVMAALRAAGEANATALVPVVYGSLDPMLAVAAARSLEAHLIMLAAAGVIARTGAGWRPIAS